MNDPAIRPASSRGSLFRRIFASILCVIGGWLTLFCYLLYRAYFFHLSVEGAQRPPDWFQMPFVIGSTALVYIAATWLLFVLPLFLFVSPHSLLWRWPVSITVFGLLGAGVMWALFRFHVSLGLGLFIGLASLTGAATGLFAAFAQSKSAHATNAA